MKCPEPVLLNKWPFLLLICALLFFSSHRNAWAQGNSNQAPKKLQKEFDELEWAGLSLAEVEEKIQQIELSARKQDFLNLLEAKNYLINGQVKRAQFFLEKWRPKGQGIQMVRNRYLALIYFIQDRFADMNEILDNKFFSNVTYYPQVCMLKFMGAIVARDRKKMKEEFFTCGPHTFHFSDTEHMWPESLYKFASGDSDALRGKDLGHIARDLEDNNIIRIWLKLGLYTNRERFLEPYLQQIPGEAYQSHKTRELLGLIYYRLDDDKKALEFVEDLSGPNAENIKGNIEMTKGQYELAFGHFKLALLKKENSKNAIERALPLAWILGQYKDGLSLLSRILDQETDIRKKVLLNTAFQVRLGNFQRSHQQMRSLKMLFQGELPKEAAVMGSYIALMNEDIRLAYLNANNACRKNDGLNCWFLYQSIIWDDLSKTMKRDEQTYSDTEVTSNDLKQKTTGGPLKETLLIDQKDIEELDGIEVQLLGQKAVPATSKKVTVVH
ncbi:MAG: hypothetical protein A2X86_15015 [Bdellovibrionales bacterium GWA2_49_15]|nr:MAG: hypothetical protein A2X86_15015 [Bdellovibrionales bacterium GWA2_49_15]HAZ13346.1 hypothetical protein [Bdellovibrionales bacterium]